MKIRYKSVPPQATDLGNDAKESRNLGTMHLGVPRLDILADKNMLSPLRTLMRFSSKIASLQLFQQNNAYRTARALPDTFQIWHSELCDE